MEIIVLSIIIILAYAKLLKDISGTEKKYLYWVGMAALHLLIGTGLIIAGVLFVKLVYFIFL